MKKIIDSSDVIGTLIFSGLVIVIEYALSRVPYAGVFLLMCPVFFFGYGLGYVVLPRWSEVVVTVCTLGEVFLGVKYQMEFVQSSLVIAGIITLVSAGLFFWGFARGCSRDHWKAEGDTDGN